MRWTILFVCWLVSRACRSVGGVGHRRLFDASPRGRSIPMVVIVWLFFSLFVLILLLTVQFWVLVWVPPYGVRWIFPARGA